MTQAFYLSDGETTVGPYSITEIVDQMIQGEFSAEHFVYLSDSEEWIKIKDFNPIMKRFEIMSRLKKSPSVAQVLQADKAVTLSEEGQNLSQLGFVEEEKTELVSNNASFDDDITQVIPLDELLAAAHENLSNVRSLEAPVLEQSLFSEEAASEVLAEAEEADAAVNAMQLVQIQNGQTVIEISHDICDKIDLDILANETNLVIEESHKEILVNAGAATRFAINGSDRAHAGDTLTLLVQAQDDFANLVDAYVGDIEVMISGSAEVVFAKIHNGRGTVRVTNTKAELTEVTILDRSSPEVRGVHQIKFAPGKAVKLVIDTPENAIAGQKIQVAIRAVDQFGNTVTDFNGAVGLNIRAGKKSVQTSIAHNE